MKDQLKKLIEAEDRKNPYTDEQLAKMLNMRRDAVTILRSELNIPDSRERRKPYLEREIKKIISENPNISNRQLTKAIKDSGFNVSRYLISQMAKEIRGNRLEISEGFNQETDLTSQNIPKIPEESSAFKRIIG
ncbi:MAG: transcriptional regulator, partial [Tepidanaerobacteraceae bacterium]